MGKLFNFCPFLVKIAVLMWQNSFLNLMFSVRELRKEECIYALAGSFIALPNVMHFWFL